MAEQTEKVNLNDDSQINYINYLRSYKWNLELFLRYETMEVYIEVIDRCFQVPLEMSEKLAIEQELNRINRRLVEFERFNNVKKLNDRK